MQYDFERDRDNFSWPEAIVFDMLHEHYSDIDDKFERSTITRLHAKVIEDVFNEYDSIWHRVGRRSSTIVRSETLTYILSMSSKIQS